MIRIQIESYESKNDREGQTAINQRVVGNFRPGDILATFASLLNTFVLPKFKDDPDGLADFFVDAVDLAAQVAEEYHVDITELRKQIMEEEYEPNL